jgi:hypothetical protein
MHRAQWRCSQQGFFYLLSLRGFSDLCKCPTTFIFKADITAEAILFGIYIPRRRVVKRPLQSGLHNSECYYFVGLYILEVWE